MNTPVMLTVAEIRADLKPQTVYVCDDAGAWVFFTDTATVSGALDVVRELVGKGKAAVMVNRRGPGE